MICPIGSVRPMPTVDVVVIGAGLAGLACAADLAERGARVFLAAKGMASTHWAHGGVDVAAGPHATTTRAAVKALTAVDGHPYAILGSEIEPALEAHRARMTDAGIGLAGSLDLPIVQVPTAIGTLRPCAFLPDAQAPALEPWRDEGLLIVGFERYRDAWPAYAASNLELARWPAGPAEVRSVSVALDGLDRLQNLNARTLALRFDDEAWRAGAIRAIAAAVPPGRWRVGLPAVLGVERHRDVLDDARAALGGGVFEIASLPPSIPGQRVFDAMRERILRFGGRIQVGFDVVGVERAERTIVAVHTEAASRTLRLVADRFVLATGGIAGAGIRAEPDGSLHERVFGLAVSAPPRDGWFSDDPLEPHPLEAAGIRTDAALRPLDPAGTVALENVHVVGSGLAGMHYLGERCGDGVALASAQRAAGLLAAGEVAA
jgi:glycerol-3-phosphate dehydrogenase subunit B